MSGTLDALSRRIDTTRSLESIVRTMKALSTASIAQYDRAASTMSAYMRTVELGMTAVLRQSGPAQEMQAGGGTTMAIVFGSDYGFCGSFNERVAQAAVAARQPRTGHTPAGHASAGHASAGHVSTGHASAGRARRSGDADNDGACRWRWLCVGARAAPALATLGEAADGEIHLPGTAEGLAETCNRILLTVDDWRRKYQVQRIVVFHNRRRAETVEPHRVQLAPQDAGWLQEIARRPWRSRALPTFTMPAPELYAALVREHLFASLFRSGAESLASEHAARLAAMHAALNNIEEHLESMNAEYQRQRQDAITAELLDIVAGYEILRKRETAS